MVASCCVGSLSSCSTPLQQAFVDLLSVAASCQAHSVHSCPVSHFTDVYVLNLRAVPMELSTEGRNTQFHQAAEGMMKVFGFSVNSDSQIDLGKTFKS